jgi:CubicO group peptidase (beta-lactamase class C family)
MVRAVWLALALVLVACRPAAPDRDHRITVEMTRGHIPGLAAAIVRRGEIIWIGTYGLADVEAGRPVTRDTLFMLASMSKAVTATAVMQLVEAGKLDLDADIDRYLAFPVRNPHAADVPITTRQLLTHTSSITDDLDRLLALYTDGDSPIALDALVRGYLVPGGAYYDATRNFAVQPPGRASSYCNYGYALLGDLVEQVSGTPFPTFTREHIFAPLAMDDTSWFLRDVDARRVATPYTWTGGGYQRHAQYGYPDYPDGELRTSIVQLARFFAAETSDGKPIVTTASLDQMHTVQFPALPDGDDAYGLGWFERYGMWGHTGHDTGVSNAMWFRARDGVGVIVLSNAGDFQDPVADRATDDAIHRIEDLLFASAGS